MRADIIVLTAKLSETKHPADFIENAEQDKDNQLTRIEKEVYVTYYVMLRTDKQVNK